MSYNNRVSFGITVTPEISEFLRDLGHYRRKKHGGKHGRSSIIAECITKQLPALKAELKKLQSTSD